MLSYQFWKDDDQEMFQTVYKQHPASTLKD